MAVLIISHYTLIIINLVHRVKVFGNISTLLKFDSPPQNGSCRKFEICKLYIFEM